MKYLVVSAALAAALGWPHGSAAAADAPAFSDDACPQANGAGRKLNALGADPQHSNDDMLAAAQGLVDAYRDCARGFDQTVNMKNNDAGSTDYIIVHRSYARLQLARSLQRVGKFDEQLHEPEKARGEYGEALAKLAEIEAILANSANSSAGSEENLLKESRQLHDDIVAEQANLPAPAPTASP